MDDRPLTRPLGIDALSMTLESAPVFTAQALPTPTDTPRQTPSRDPPQHGRRRRSSSTPSIPKDSGSQYGKRGSTHDRAIGEEDISPLDPRRFTPTLHASLVSQILTLQREVENKNKTIHNLEDFLHITKAEKDQLDHSLKDQVKENRSTKKQMQLLESTTLTALGDVAKERDEAHESLADTRKRLETSKGRIRNQEEEADNARSLWDKERQNWDMEKRNMETKVHLVEGRLKAVLAEIAAAQANGYDYPSTSTELEDSVYRTWYTKGTDSTPSRSDSVKRQSRMSGQSNDTNEVSEYLNYRASTLSGLNGFGTHKRNGISLADELDFGADESDQDEVMAPDALPEEAHLQRRRPSVQNILQDQKAWKLLGLLPENVEQIVKEEGLTEKTAVALGDNHTLIEKPSVEDEKTLSHQKPSAAQRMESATQSSPPSPSLPPELDDVPSEKLTERASTIEHTANQSRKRISIPLPMEQAAPAKPVSQVVSPMVSAGCQTINQPPSPPLTRIIKIEPLAPASLRADKEVGTVSSSMQTDDQEQTVPPAASTRQKPSSMMIPVIEIHPPGSRPASSHTSVVLPPRTKNASCQASIALPVSIRSVSVQTESIIPARQPFSLASKPLSKSVSHPSLPLAGLGKIEEHSHEPPQPAPRKSSRKHPPRPSESSRPRIKASVSAPVVDRYPANNHSNSSTSKQPTSLRCPVRDESLFAGFDSSFTNKSLKLEDLDLSSDDDFATVAPIRKTLSKVQNSWKLVPHSEADSLGRLGSGKNSVENLDIDESSDPWLASLVPFDNQEPVIPRTHSQNASAKPLVPSKAGGNPTTNQATTLIKAPEPGMPRRRSPSAPCLPEKDSSTIAPPPFPVPTRSSSRRVPISASEGAQSPTPYSTTFFSTAQRREAGNPPLRNPLRKVQSAATVTRRGRSSGQTKKPTQSTSPPRLASGSPQLLKMSKNYTTHQPQHVQQTTHALPATSLSTEALIDRPGQSTTVVDAIAQTMVGEWMWKYVRRRKSFGVTDNVDFDENGNGDGNGIRYKRWVWLAPYERAVMWSSKQPTSGPALMGKSGRKRKLSRNSVGSSSNRVGSQHPVSARCQGRHTDAQEFQPADMLCSIHPHPDASASFEVHRNSSRQTLRLA